MDRNKLEMLRYKRKGGNRGIIVGHIILLSYRLIKQIAMWRACAHCHMYVMVKTGVPDDPGSDDNLPDPIFWEGKSDSIKNSQALQQNSTMPKLLL